MSRPARPTRAGVFIVLCLGATLTEPAPGDALELGPAPIGNGQFTGRVSSIVCSPLDPDRYYIGGADGGVWRTTDGGASWTPLTDHMPTTAIGALALDPTDEDIIYAGTGEANYANHSRYGVGIYKSFDGGDSWTQFGADVFAGRCFSRIVVNPQNPNIVYASVTRAGGFPELAAAKGHPGATGPVGVFQSFNGGLDWVQLSGGLPALSATDLCIDPANPAVLYAAIGRIFGDPDNGIYKTTDGGASWSKLSGGLATSVGRISIAISPDNPSRLYTLMTRPADAAGGEASVRGAFRSDNAGATWTSIPVGDIQATYGWYLSVVSVRPGDPNTVIMGGLSLRRSTNSGAGWSTITPPHVDLHAAAWDAAGRLLVGDDGGVHRSANVGSSWESLNSGLGLIQFYAGLSTHPSDSNVIFGGTQDNGSNRRQSNSEVWTQVFGGDGGWTQLDQRSPNRVFVEYQGTGNLFRSTNGGDSFQAVASGINGNDRNCFLPPYVIDPSNSNRMLYGTHRVYASFNGGSAWSAISGDLTNGSGAIRTLAMAPSDPSVVYAATNDGNMLVTFDQGAHWDLIAQGVPGWPRVTREIFVDPNDALTAYLAVSYFGETQIQRTRDAGQTWEPLDEALPDVPVNVVAADERGIFPTIYAGTDAGLYRSINDGASWHRYQVGVPNAPVIDLLLEIDRERLIVATQGRGAWRVPISVPGDMNGDLVVDGADIDPFILALGDPIAYGQQFPFIDPEVNGDMNGDGVLDGADIDGFVNLLKG